MARPKKTRSSNIQMMASEQAQRSNSVDDFENGNTQAQTSLDAEGAGTGNDQETSEGEKKTQTSPKQEKSDPGSTTAHTTAKAPSPTAEKTSKDPAPAVDIDTASLLVNTPGQTDSGVPRLADAGASQGNISSSSESSSGPTSLIDLFLRCLQSKYCVLCLSATTVGIMLLVVIIFTVVVPHIRHEIMKHLILSESNSQKWIRPGVPAYLHMHFFDMGFPDKRLQVSERGPYVYRVDLEKVNVTWNDNSTVSYREVFTFHFEEKMSKGTESDVIRIVNIPLLTLNKRAGIAGPLLHRWLSEESKKVVEEHTVGELMWGYQSAVLQDIEALKSYDFFHLFHSGNENMPSIGFFSSVNGTPGPMYNVYTGDSNFSLYNHVYSWDYDTKLHYWTTDEANKIRGTDGSLFQPFLTEDTPLTLFYSQLFRTFDLQYSERVSYKGLDTLRFIIPDSEFSNKTRTPDSPEFTEPEEDTEFSDDWPMDSDKDDESDDSKKSDRNTDSNDVTQSVTESAEVTEHETEASLSTEEELLTTDPTFDETTSDGENNFEDNSLNPRFRRIAKRQTSEAADDSSKVGNGYCTPKCVPSGMYSIAAASQGADLYISLPHFLGADPYYRRLVKGLHPVEGKHRPMFDIDETTGVTVRTRRRHQVNIHVKTEHLPEAYLPLFWIELDADVPDADLESILIASIAQKAVMGVGIGFGILVLVLFISAITCCICNVVTGQPDNRYRPLNVQPHHDRARGCLCCR